MCGLGHVSPCAATRTIDAVFYGTRDRSGLSSLLLLLPPGAAAAAAAAVTAAVGCTPPLGYVIYRPVKGSVKISVAATRMRVVSAMSCICSLSRLQNGHDDSLTMFALPTSIYLINLTIKLRVIPLRNDTNE